jgi:hypothetical protein
MQPTLKTQFGSGKKQYCRQGPYHRTRPIAVPLREFMQAYTDVFGLSVSLTK